MFGANFIGTKFYGEKQVIWKNLRTGIHFWTYGMLTQRELYRLGLITTVFCTAVFLIIGTPWILWVG